MLRFAAVMLVPVLISQISLTAPSVAGSGERQPGIGIVAQADPDPAIEFRAASTSAATAATSIEIARPEGTVEGDVLIAALSGTGSWTATVPAGWAFVLRTTSSSTMTQTVLFHVAGASEPASYTFSVNAQVAALAGGLLAYSGVDAVAPVDVFGGQGNGSSTSITAPSVTTTAAGDMLIGIFGIASDPSVTPPGSMTTRLSQTASGASKVTLAVADELRASAGATGTRVASSTLAAANVGQVVALRATTEYVPAITFRGSSSASATAASSIELSRPVGVEEADTLVAVLTYRSTGAAIVPPGWMFVQSNVAWNAITQAVYVHVLGPSEPAEYTFSFSGTMSVITGGILGYRGVDAVTPVETSSGQYAASTSMTAPSAGTSHDDSLVIALFGSAASVVISTPPSMVARLSQTVVGGTSATLAVADQAAAATGVVGNRVATSTTADGHVAQLVVLQSKADVAPTIALRGSTSASATAASSLQITKPSGVEADDVMLAAIAATGSWTSAPPDGWNLVRSTASSSTMTQVVYSRVAGVSEPSSYTFTFSGELAAVAGGVVAYSGVNPASPLDGSSGQGNGSGSAITAPSLTLTTGDAVLVGFFGIASDPVVTPPSRMASRLSQTASGVSKVTLAVTDQQLSLPDATDTRAAASSKSAASVGQLVALHSLAPSAPTDVAATALSSDAVGISWVAPADPLGIVQYTLYRNGARLVDIAGHALEYVDDSVSPTTTYSYTLAATDGAGNTSVQSDAAIVTTPADVTSWEPAPPTNVSATAVAWDEVDVSWTASSDDVGVSEYDVFRDGLRLAAVDGTETTFVDRTTVWGTQYVYTVRAADADGNTSEMSAPATGTTPSPPVNTLVVALTTPSPAWTLFHEETLAAAVSGGTGTVSVQFCVDGTPVGSDDVAPYSITWDSTTVSDGAHVVTAVATDEADGEFESEPITASVANGLAADARVRADFEGGRITLDEYALGGTYALLAMYAAPERYWSSTPPAGGLGPIVGFLERWDELSQSTQDEITAFVEQPLRGELYAPSPLQGQSERGDRSSGASLSTSAENPECVEGDCTHLTSGGHFRVFYGGYVYEGALEDIPQEVIEIGNNLEDAFEFYTKPRAQGGRLELQPPVQGGLDRIDVNIQPAGWGAMTLPWGEIHLSKGDSRLAYNAPHELIHVFQYRDMGGALAFMNRLHAQLWWMEASGEWATHEATRDLSGAIKYEYASCIGGFLSRPERAWSEYRIGGHCQSWDGMGDNAHAYGQFLLAEYLVQHLTDDVYVKTSQEEDLNLLHQHPNIIESTWLRMGSGGTANDAIKAEITAHGNNPILVTDVVADYAAANYRLDYDDSHVGSVSAEKTWGWRLEEFAGSTTKGTDGLAPARPARWTAGRLSWGRLELKVGGATYIDLVPPQNANLCPRFWIHLSTPGGQIYNMKARVLVFSDYPSYPGTLIEEIPVDFGTLDGGKSGADVHVSLVGPGGARAKYAVVVVSYVKYDNMNWKKSQKVWWTAEYEDAGVASFPNDLPETRVKSEGGVFKIWEGCLNGSVRDAGGTKGRGDYTFTVTGAADPNVWGIRLHGLIDKFWAPPLVGSFFHTSAQTGPFDISFHVYGSSRLMYGLPVGWHAYALYSSVWWAMGGPATVTYADVDVSASDGSPIPGH